MVSEVGPWVTLVGPVIIGITVVITGYLSYYDHDIPNVNTLPWISDFGGFGTARLVFTAGFGVSAIVFALFVVYIEHVYKVLNDKFDFHSPVCGLARLELVCGLLSGLGAFGVAVTPYSVALYYHFFFAYTFFTLGAIWMYLNTRKLAQLYHNPKFEAMNVAIDSQEQQVLLSHAHDDNERHNLQEMLIRPIPRSGKISLESFDLMRGIFLQCKKLAGYAGLLAWCVLMGGAPFKSNSWAHIVLPIAEYILLGSLGVYSLLFYIDVDNLRNVVLYWKAVKHLDDITGSSSTV